MPKPVTQPTTAQSLGALLKSARDIMRKDKGLNGDLDRLPMLTWIMFLKFLDDLELQREGEAMLSGENFKLAIERDRSRNSAAQFGASSGGQVEIAAELLHTDEAGQTTVDDDAHYEQLRRQFET